MQEPIPSRIMEQMNADDLKKVARLLGLGKGPTRKAQVIEWLAEHIRGNLPQVLAHCSDEERLALAEVAFGGGVLDPVVFWGKYGVGCPMGRRSSYSYKEAPSPFDLLVGRDDFGKLRLAEPIAENVRTLLPEPKTVVVRTVEGDPPDQYAGRPVRVHSGEGIVFPELRRVLGLAQAGKLAVTAKGGTPTDACVRRIGEALILPDLDLEEPERLRMQWYTPAGPVRAYAWGVVVQQCGWCKPAGSKLGLARKGRATLTSGGPEALKAGVGRLLAGDGFDELNRINHIRGQTGKGKRSLTRPAARRESIASSLAEWPEGKWIAFDDAFRFVCASGHAFSVSRNPWDLFFCEKQYGSLGYEYGDGGDGLERQYLRAFLVETLATLGIVDVAYVYPHGLWPELGGRWGTDDLSFCGRYDGLRRVRLTPLGAYCLGRTETYAMPVAEVAGLVKVLPNLELVLVNEAACSPTDTARLELFASPKNERVWRMDRQRILEYIETGGTLEDIRRELDSVADNAIPETVSTFIDEMEKKTAAFKGVRPCLLIEVADEATAALIAHDPRAAKYCLAAGDRHLAVPTQNERAFRGAVKKMGYVLP